MGERVQRVGGFRWRDRLAAQSDAVRCRRCAGGLGAACDTDLPPAVRHARAGRRYGAAGSTAAKGDHAATASGHP